MTEPISVSVADVSDVVFIDSLQRKNAEELAFYPRSALERETEAGRIFLARVNGDPAGYLYHGAWGPILKIHQACIEYDLRGQLYGAALVRALVGISTQQGCMSISLRCGSDIAANGFWSAMGFYCQGITAGGVRRMRDINNWRYDIEPQLLTDSVPPSGKKADASIWRKGKGEKKSQFMRGADMKAYRAEVIERAKK